MRTASALAAACALTVLAGPAQAAVAQAAGSPEARSAAAREARSALAQAIRLRAGSGVRTGHELTPALLRLSRSLGALRGDQRARAESLLARPDDGPGDPFGDGYTTPEAALSPVCDEFFCVHWVDTGNDAPPLDDTGGTPGVPDFVEMVLEEINRVRAVENGGLGWPPPVPDGTLGGGALDRTDVYLAEVGGQRVFGYAAPDPAPANVPPRQFAFLVLDNDFSAAQFGQAPLLSLRVTAAHEYGHILHFTLDSLQDLWVFEAGGVWFEDAVYDEINDYLRYLPRWARLTRVPLTDGSQPDGFQKIYGSFLWNEFLTTRFGPDVVRNTWELSRSATVAGGASFGPAAYDLAIRRNGGAGFADAFNRFSLVMAEWRAPASGLPEGPAAPGNTDIERIVALRPDAGPTRLTLDHTTFALLDVPARSSDRLTVRATLPPGLPGAVALIGRRGPATTGALVSSLTQLPRGGRGEAVLSSTSGLDRVTAVVVNADASQSGFDQSRQDFRFTRDNQPVTVEALTGSVRPRVRDRSPRPGNRSVSPAANVTIAFDSPVARITGRVLTLTGPDGRRVPARVTFDARRARAVLDPRARLRRGVLHRVRLAGARDAGGRRLPTITWTFRTRS